MQGSSITTAASPLEAPQQMTLAGRPCQFPFFYRGVAQTSCVPYSTADSSSFCMDTDGRFGMCSPQPLSPYSTFQTWLDQWAGKGSLETAVRADSLPLFRVQRPSGGMRSEFHIRQLWHVFAAAPVALLHLPVLAETVGRQWILGDSSEHQIVLSRVILSGSANAGAS